MSGRDMAAKVAGETSMGPGMNSLLCMIGGVAGVLIDIRRLAVVVCGVVVWCFENGCGRRVTRPKSCVRGGFGGHCLRGPQIAAHEKKRFFPRRPRRPASVGLFRAI